MQRQTIGRYQIREELGRGAMGVVFRAEDSLIGRAVAIKTIRLDSFSNPAERDKLKERFLREARSAGLLSHPNIVTVYDVGEEDGVAFIAMEYLSGRTVDQTIAEQGRLDSGQVTALVVQVAAALDYAHGQGVVHRDIKPGNIMLGADGSAKITDFGVAKLLSHQATQAEMMLGTPNYMAPEQIDARGIDGRADQFALAVIAYEILTGERPFTADALSALLVKILREEPAPPHRLNATLNERVSAVIARGLAKAPASRFDNCSAFARALTAALASCGNWQPMTRAASSTMATVMGPIATPEPGVKPELPPKPQALEPPAFTKLDPPRRSKLFLSPVVGGALLSLGYWLYSQPVVPVPAAAPETPRVTADESRPSPLAADPVAVPPPPLAGPPTATNSVPTPAGPVSGLVEIASTPAGSIVRIDDTKDQCKTPCSMELSQGRHVLHFTLDGHRNGTLIIAVPMETTAQLQLDPLIGTLMVLSTPPGATILLNDQTQKAVTPATLRLAPGKYKLSLRREGARDHTQEIEVREEAITQVEFSWP